MGKDETYNVHERRITRRRPHEQNVGQALRIVDRCAVMRSGRVILEETREQMLARDSYWDLF